MCRGRRKVFLFLVSCSFLILLVIMTVRQGVRQPKRNPSGSPRTRDAKRGDAKRLDGKRLDGKRLDAKRPDAKKAASSPYKYKVFDNNDEADQEVDSSKDQGQNEQGSDPLDIRTFSSTSEQLLYLYNKALSAPWTPNSKNVASFRDVFFRGTKNMTIQDELILTHQNVKLGDSLPYTFNMMSKDGVKYFFNITQEILDQIPQELPLSRKKFRRCSVVGNSGILHKSKCGKEIDSSDFVFRANIPPIRPFAADAGWKSNLSTMNPSVAIKRYNRLKKEDDHEEFARGMGEYNGIIWLPCVGSVKMVDICLLAKQSIDSHGGGNPTTVISNPLHYMAVQYFWNNRNLTHFISTGFYVTHLSLAMCDETHLYGFWPFDTMVEDSDVDANGNVVSFRQRQVRYHYFDNLPRTVNGAHSMQHEFGVLVQMHKLGMLKMHVNSCQE